MKKLFSVFALLFLFGSSLTALAYWDVLTTGTDETVTIGEGTTIVLNETVVPSGENLVPSGVVMKSGDTTSVVFEYEVELDQTPLEDLLLIIVAENVLIDGSDEDISLVNIDIQAPTHIGGSAVTVVVTVTLDEPTSEAQYNRVANGTISFDLVIEAEIE